jgi:hypothetical protein
MNVGDAGAGARATTIGERDGKKQGLSSPFDV